MVEKIRSFEQLNVWQDSAELSVRVYKATKQFPSEEQFALTNQLRRAPISVSANIAEGFGRKSSKDKLHFYATAYGSLLEAKSFIYLAERLGYLDKATAVGLIEYITSLQKQLNSLNGAIKNHA